MTKILVRMPNWLGDAVMATPALNNLVQHYSDAEFVLVGSKPVADVFQSDPRFSQVVVDTSKSDRFRLRGIWRLGSQLCKEHGPFDLAVAFTNSVSSRVLLRATKAKQRVAKKRGWRDALLTHAVPCDGSLHVAEIYNQMVNGFLKTDYPTGPTSLHIAEKYAYKRPTVGVNPGAAYGSAKRWEPQKFAEVAATLATDFDVVIFGGPNEREMSGEVEQHLRRLVDCNANVQNLAGRTTISELLERIAGLSLFITNDSGPMHIAGAFGIPTIAIFGSTNHVQTCQWSNPKSAIVRHDVDCAPCMKRVCPLQHHACMREVQPAAVVSAARSLIGNDQTIADLRSALTAAAEGMPEVRQKFPAKWWEIKEWLENMKQPYLDYAAYQDRCRKLGEEEPANQE